MHQRLRFGLPALLLILSMLVTACGGSKPTTDSGKQQSSSPSSSSSQTQTAAPAKKEPKGTLTVIQGAEPDLLQPLYSDGSTEYTVIVNIMEGLFTTGKDLEIVPVLAESYKIVDDVTWEFKLKKGIKFHNGEPFTAESVKLSYGMALDPAMKVRNAWAGDINLKEVQVVDDYTVRFITKAPTPHVLARMANDHFMYPPKYYAEVGKDGFGKKPIGTGPYKFKQWDKGEKIILEANTEYWGGMPSIKEAVWRFVPEEGARIAELETGNADVVIGVAPDQVHKLKGKAKSDVVAIEGGRRVYLGLLTEGNVPTAKLQVRQAINHAINVEAIAEALFAGSVKRMPTPINPPNRNPELKGYSYDPAKAKQLLAEAGYPNGFSMDFEAYAGVALKDKEFLQAVVADLRQVGINANLKMMERKAFNKQVAERKNAPMYLRTTAGGFDMGIDMILFRPTHKGNGTKWEPKEFVDLYQAVFTTVDPAKRKEHSYKIQKLIVEQAPWVFLWRQPEIYGVSKRLKGFDPQGDERIRVYQLSLSN